MQQKPTNELKQKLLRFILLVVIVAVLYYFFSDGSAEGNSTIRQGVKGVFKGL